MAHIFFKPRHFLEISALGYLRSTIDEDNNHIISIPKIEEVHSLHRQQKKINK